MFQKHPPKGSAELLILALVEERERHGYEIAKLIEQRSGGAFSYHVASLYPMLYRLERRGYLRARWIEQAGMRRRRFYKLTPDGRKVLDAERRRWGAFVDVLRRVARVRHAQ